MKKNNIKNEIFMPESFVIDKNNFINNIENINNILLEKIKNHKRKCDSYDDEYLKKIIDIFILFKKLQSLMKYLKCSAYNNNKNSEYILKLFNNINKGKIINDNSIEEMSKVQDKISEEITLINKLYKEYIKF